MISVVICSLITKPEKRDILKRCVNSLRGADEVVIYAPTNYNDGFCKSWNFAASLAKGDYLVLMGDSNIQVRGDLKDLAVEGTVTSPLINGKSQEFWGFCFCVPRDIYEKYGLYDIVYNKGAHYMDSDLWKRYQKEGVPIKSISTVNLDHPSGGDTVQSSIDFFERQEINLNIYNERWNK